MLLARRMGWVCTLAVCFPSCSRKLTCSNVNSRARVYSHPSFRTETLHFTWPHTQVLSYHRISNYLCRVLEHGHYPKHKFRAHFQTHWVRNSASRTQQPVPQQAPQETLVRYGVWEALLHTERVVRTPILPTDLHSVWNTLREKLKNGLGWMH